jgi:hypothetical protein
MGIHLLRLVGANNVPISDVFAAISGDLAFVMEEYSLSHCDEAAYFGQEGFHLNIFVLWMFHQMMVFKEFSGILVKNGVCKIV